MSLLPATGFKRLHPFYVYELVGDDGTTFYVGRTSNPQKRLAQHLSPTYSRNNPVHLRLLSQSAPRMKISSGHESMSSAALAEAQLIRELPGLVNAPVGKPRVQSSLRLTAKLSREALAILDGSRLGYEPVLERGSFLTSLLLFLNEKHPEALKAAAESAVLQRGDRFVVRIDGLPPIDGGSVVPQ